MTHLVADLRSHHRRILHKVTRLVPMQRKSP